MLKKYLDNFIGSLGYVKAGEVKNPVQILYSGEIEPGQDVDIWADWTALEFERLAITNYAVYRNIMLIAKMIAQATLTVEQKDSQAKTGWSQVLDHDFEKIIEHRPNPLMSQSFIWMYQIAWLLLHGEAYWMLVPNRLGELTQVYPLPAGRVKPLPHPKLGIMGYAYTPVSGKEPDILKPDQVCFHRLPNPFNYYQGLSPLSAFLMGLKLSTEAQKHDLDDYQNKLNLQQLISLGKGTSNRDFFIAEEDLRRANEMGLRWKLIRAGEIDVKNTSAPRGSHNTEIYKITEQQANNIFGVPDSIWERDTNRASSGEHKKTLIEDTVWPLMEMVSEDITIQMVYPYYDEDTRVSFEDIRPANRELDLKEKEASRRVWTYNEARQAEGLEDHPDPDIGNAPFEAAAKIAQIKFTLTGRQPSPEPVADEKADLKRWKSIALRMFKAGDNPGGYEFTSQVISADKVTRIKAALTAAETEADIKAAFTDRGLTESEQEIQIAVAETIKYLYGVNGHA